MALIGCPECENEISDKCTSCPKCGYPINSTAPEAKAAIIVDRDRSLLTAFNSFAVFINGEDVGKVDAGKDIIIEVPLDPTKLVAVLTVQVKMEYTLFKTKPLKLTVTPNEVVNLRCGKTKVRNKTFLKLSSVQKNQNVGGLIAQGASKGIAQAVVTTLLKGAMR